jgi:F-type H+-transporting ATPase subunit b
MLPQLEIGTYFSQIFWLIICVSIIYVFLKHIFIPRLESSMEARKNYVQKLMLEASKMQVEAEGLNKKYQDEIKKCYQKAHQENLESIAEFDKQMEEYSTKLSKDISSKVKALTKEIEKLKSENDKKVEEESEKLLELFDKKISDSYGGKK